MAKLVSVPYRGFKFLNENGIDVEYTLNCFRPLSGFQISQCVEALDLYVTGLSFRPLSGFQISQ